MAETDLWFGTLSATVRVEDLPASRQVVAIELPANGEWRVCGAGTSNADGIAMLPITGMPTSRIYAVAIDDWGRPFVPGMTVAFGDVIRPTQFLGWMYQVTSPGELPSTEPDWWNSMPGVPQPVGTAMMQAVRHYQPIAHGPVGDIEWEEDLPWTPAELLVPPHIWLDDQSEIVEADGAVVQWKDNSLNGWHFSQPNFSQRPVTTVGENGARAIRFNGTSQRMLCTTPLARGIFQNSSGGWIFSVLAKSIVDTAGINRTIMRSNIGTGVPARFSLQVGTADMSPGANRIELGARRTDSDSFANLGGSPGGVADLGVHAVMGIMDWATGAASIFCDGYLEGSQIITTPGLTSNTPSSSDIVLGGDHFAGRFFAGDLYAVIVGSGALPDESDRQRLEGWAAWRYGFVENLPVDHPYKSEPPKITE